MRDWIMNEKGMEKALASALKLHHCRLYALGVKEITPVEWHSSADEAEMLDFMREQEKEGQIPIVVVDARDTIDTIKYFVKWKFIRMGSGSGYFPQSF
jgi:hypothetical protein